ncbi:MAG TPA: hypothetical protein VFB72_08015 [Verrucomicrobiae bacterium]|nr:hypothetical protein [Verrucomicrobiae bacterium]
MKYVNCALALFCKAAFGQETLGQYKWQDLKTVPVHATLAQVDGRQVLKIENTNDAPLQVNLLTIEQPKITAIVYQLTGEVRYDSVKGDGYLEMWNIFPEKDGSPGGEYFSKTLADSGPLGKISGTSGWREFALPFDRTGSASPPTRLQVNLVLPGRGTVYIGPMKLMQMPKAKSASAMIYPNEWWDGPTSAKICGVGGGLLGCLGVLCAALAAKGKARGFVTGVLFGLSVLGGACGLGGFIGLALGQPFFVWLPLLFAALVLLTICPVNLRRFRKKCEELELRRMASIDAATG